MPDPIRPDSPLGRAKQAAEDGDFDGVQSELPAISEAANGAKASADAGDAAALLKFLEALGVVVGTSLREMVEVLDKIQAAIDLLNAILDLTVGPALKTDTEVTLFPIILPPAELFPLQIELSAEIDKQSRGWVILNNQEEIEKARVSLKTLNGVQLDSVALTCRFTAIGAGQDGLDVGLAYATGDGGGPPAALPVSSSSDAFGFSVEEVFTIIRTGTTKFEFELKPSPGVIKYGLNGANLAVQLEVTGYAMYKGVFVTLVPVVVTDVGVSV
jgi:hypothetical protein